MAYTAPNFLKNHKVHFRGPVGSIEGPWLVLDPIEVWSCVLRVTWNVVCCSICKNIADTADFRVGGMIAPSPLPFLAPGFRHMWFCLGRAEPIRILRVS